MDRAEVGAATSDLFLYQYSFAAALCAGFFVLHIGAVVEMKAAFFTV